MIAMVVAVVGVIIFIERGQRKIPVQYAKRLVGRKIYGGQSTHLPLKVNTAGVIPPIFASSIIMFPATIAGFIAIPWVQGVAKQLSPGTVFYTTLYIGMIFFFAYFYTAIVFNPVDIADNLKKIWGIYSGHKTGTEDIGIHLQGYVEINICRRSISCSCVYYSGDSYTEVQCPFLFWRHLAADCCRSCA